MIGALDRIRTDVQARWRIASAPDSHVGWANRWRISKSRWAVLGGGPGIAEEGFFDGMAAAGTVGDVDIGSVIVRRRPQREDDAGVELEVPLDARPLHQATYGDEAGAVVVHGQTGGAHGGFERTEVFAEDEKVGEFEVVDAFVGVGDAAADTVDVLGFIAMGRSGFQFFDADVDVTAVGGLVRRGGA